MKSYPSIIGNILETFSERMCTIFDCEDEMNKLHRKFKANDLVLIQTETISRIFRPLARINETYVSNDVNVHSVKLKLPSNTVIRPSNKLCLLEEYYGKLASNIV